MEEKELETITSEEVVEQYKGEMPEVQDEGENLIKLEDEEGK